LQTWTPALCPPLAQAKSLYTAGRAIIGTQVIENMTTALASRGIVTEDVLMRSIALPRNVSQ
jgi:regulator of protease activity HflC (stomatin/prohibitin superfamily)